MGFFGQCCAASLPNSRMTSESRPVLENFSRRPVSELRARSRRARATLWLLCPYISPARRRSFRPSTRTTLLRQLQRDVAVAYDLVVCQKLADAKLLVDKSCGM